MHKAGQPWQEEQLTWCLHGQGKASGKAPAPQQGAGAPIFGVAKGSICLCIWEAASCSLHSPNITLRLSAKPVHGDTFDGIRCDDALLAGAQVELAAGTCCAI